VNNRPQVIRQPEGAKLSVPAGFQVEIYQEGFKVPRMMLLGPSNEILLSDAARGKDGAVYVLQGKERKAIIEGLDRPYGLALQDGYLYVGEPESIKRYKYDAKAKTAGPGQEIASLKGFGSGHWTRSLIFSRDGKRLCVGTGSGSNVSPGEDPKRAAINCYNPDGSGHEIYAAGTRNPTSIRYYPGTDTLWAAVQERDELGDDLVPDFFTHIQKGGFYGWPYAYSGPNEDPRNKGQRPDLDHERSGRRSTGFARRRAGFPVLHRQAIPCGIPGWSLPRLPRILEPFQARRSVHRLHPVQRWKAFRPDEGRADRLDAGSGVPRGLGTPRRYHATAGWQPVHQRRRQ
jgi:hypothetical protein